MYVIDMPDRFACNVSIYACIQTNIYLDVYILPYSLGEHSMICYWNGEIVFDQSPYNNLSDNKKCLKMWLKVQYLVIGILSTI